MQHAQPQTLSEFAMVGLAVTGSYASDAHLHTYCCIMCQSLGRLLVALQSIRSLRKLKLDFTVFSCFWAQPSADALMALECLWLYMEDLLVANGHIRFAASFVISFLLSKQCLLICCLSTQLTKANGMQICMVPNVS